MTIRIDTHIPIPHAKTVLNGDLYDAMDKLTAVGMSFICPAELRTRTVYDYAKRLNIRITARKTNEGLRIWRIK
jgi:hypothetical protein